VDESDGNNAGESGMSKHTPGPWRVGGNSWFVNQIPIEPAIGCAYGAGYEVKANARLIAAAPELLEALQILAEHDFGVNGWTPLLESAAIKARAAIRKATGESGE